MTTRTPGDGVAVRARRLLAVLASLVGGPFLLLLGYLLAWFSPEVTGQYRAVDRGAALWTALLLAWLAAAGCLSAGWLRLRRPGRWWPWPVGLAVALAVGYLTADALVRVPPG
ncbi:hypothetical protein [Micromonospora auratinigra]|uniref:Uncharacterized protein n=1 Tax=Micromonospora auratinigra TaxID=261654 RepID=A0A1A9A9X5_9ACTN|nr:hypothetical protein [Micromonospora auratinigra]SBT52935.1 hypothetical protein GA0070611_5868 [Micromonospora auratinigra]